MMILLAASQSVYGQVTSSEPLRTRRRKVGLSDSIFRVKVMGEGGFDCLLASIHTDNLDHTLLF